MPDFILKLKNSTDQTWYFGIYQEFPEAVLDSVVWKAQGVPPNGSDQIKWHEDYGVALVKLDDTSIIGKQVQPGDLGKEYEAVIVGGVPSINPDYIGSSGADDIIKLRNNTNPAEKVNMGFSLTNDIIAVQKDVYGNATGEYQVHPTYYVDLNSQIQVGTFVTATVSTDPQILQFPTGIYTMVAEAVLDGEAISLKIYKE